MWQKPCLKPGQTRIVKIGSVMAHYLSLSSTRMAVAG